MDILAIILGLILTFVTVVVIHELGHFFAAKMVGVKASVFSVGFGKPIWSRTDRNGVVWQVTRIPAGGYVKFVGDENAASLSVAADGPIVPGSLRSVSKRAQAWVAVAGPLANVIFTAFVLSALPLVSGETAYPWTIADVAEDAGSMDLLPGDQILSIDGIDIAAGETLAAVVSRLPASSDVDYRIDRNGTEKAVFAPRPDLPLIGFVADGSPADLAGLLVGDHVAQINGMDLHSWSDLQRAVSGSNGTALAVTFLRNGQSQTVSVTPLADGDRWLLGVSSAPLLSLTKQTPSLLSAVGSGVSQTWDLMANLATGLASSLLTLEASCDLDGPIGIASVAGQAIQLGPETFLLFLAVISLGLGVLNLLPIPILDGGHLMMLGYQGLTGRPMGKKVEAIVFIVGVTLIVFLMLSATINDLTC